MPGGRRRRRQGDVACSENFSGAATKDRARSTGRTGKRRPITSTICCFAIIPRCSRAAMTATSLARRPVRLNRPRDTRDDRQRHRCGKPRARACVQPPAPDADSGPAQAAARNDHRIPAAGWARHAGDLPRRTPALHQSKRGDGDFRSIAAGADLQGRGSVASVANRRQSQRTIGRAAPASPNRRTRPLESPGIRRALSL